VTWKLELATGDEDSLSGEVDPGDVVSVEERSILVLRREGGDGRPET
jgi:hypothetical protein